MPFCMRFGEKDREGMFLCMFKKFFGQLQRIGKALMLPVAILPAAGLLLAIGTAIQGESYNNTFHLYKMEEFKVSVR